MSNKSVSDVKLLSGDKTLIANVDGEQEILGNEDKRMDVSGLGRIEKRYDDMNDAQKVTFLLQKIEEQDLNRRDSDREYVRRIEEYERRLEDKDELLQKAENDYTELKREWAMAADVFDKSRIETECTRRNEQKALQDQYDVQSTNNLKHFEKGLRQLAAKHVVIVGQWEEAIGRRDKKIERLKAVIASHSNVQVLSSSSSVSASPSQIT